MGDLGKTAWVTGTQRSGLMAWLLASSAIATVGYSPDAIAQLQLIPDGTLGTTVTPDVLINGVLSDRIDDGTVAGSNLFHSFSEFNINVGEQVYFANPIGITDILSRITGTDISNIDGLLGVEGDANLFLLNPNGVVFGPGAELDINGSFTTSTADSITFAEGGEFSALTTVDELLTFSTPLGVQFNNDQPQGNITNEAALQVGTGETLTLFGNTVVSNVLLGAPGGTARVLGNQISLTDSVAPNPAALSGDTNLSIEAFNGIRIEDLADNELSFIDGTGTITFVADADADGRGDVVMRDVQDTLQTNGRDLTISGDNLTLGIINTAVVSGIPGDSGSVELTALSDVSAEEIDTGTTIVGADGGDISIASLSGEISPGTLISDSTNGGDGGAISLETVNTITITDDIEANNSSDLILRASTIEVNNATIRQSGGGDIVLETPQIVGSEVIVNRGRVITDVPTGGTFDGGDIRITTHDLTAVNSGGISASTLGPGNSGQVAIDATGDVVIDGVRSSISSQVRPRARGNSGGISITSNNLFVRNDATVSASTSGAGSSGQINILTSGNTEVSGGNASIESQVNPGATGSSGGINVTTGNLLVQDDGRITASTFGENDSGQVEIEATGDIVVDGVGSSIDSQVGLGAVGNSGGILLMGDNLFVSNDAVVSASTFGQGNSGQINLETMGNIEVTGSNTGIFSQVNRGAVGSSGGLDITTDNLLVQDNGRITASTTGLGDSGQINLNATGDVVVEGAGSSIESQVNLDAVGNSGGLDIITAGDLLVQDDGRITASTAGIGRSGKVEIEAAGDVVVDGAGSFISSQVRSGAVGNSGGVSVTSENVFVRNDAAVSASTFSQGSSGQVAIEATGDVVIEGTDSSIDSEVRLGAVGDSGGVSIITDNLLVQDEAEVSASTFGEGDSGQVQIAAAGTIEVVNGEINSNTNSGGDAGSIIITADGLELQGSASRIFAITDNTGSGGNITLNVPKLTFGDGGQISASTADQGDGGSLILTNDGPLIVEGDGQITVSAEPGSTGNAGTLTINTPQVTIDGVQLSASTSSSGRGGDVLLNVDQLNFENDGQIEASTSGIGDGGNIIFNPSGNSLSIVGDGRLSVETSGAGRVGTFTDLDNFNAGNFVVEIAEITLDQATLSAATSGSQVGGDITLLTSELNVANGGDISASTFGDGAGGSITINTTDLNALTGGQITASTFGNGVGGSITINAADLNVLTDGQITASTFGNGVGGSITINAADLNVLTDGQITASASGNGAGGSITINAADLNVLTGGQITASTSGSGAGGSIGINTSSVDLDGGGQISASTSGRGAGGNLNLINTEESTLLIGGENGLLTVGATSRDSGMAGTLTIDATSIGIAEVTISAESNSLEGGGNISITADDIIATALGSFINANATNSGDGGNIDISVPDGFFFTLPTGNNDIIANAEGGGNGGRVTIEAIRIFGLLPRSGFTTEELRNITTSDVSASSTLGGLDGTVTFVNIAFDPTQGLNPLPITLTDDTNQIAEGCRANAHATGQSEFVITGRGGLPASPSGPLAAGLDTVPWVTVTGVRAGSVPTAIDNQADTAPLREAQGWTTQANGEVFFVANPTVSAESAVMAPHASGIPTASLCSAAIAP